MSEYTKHDWHDGLSGRLDRLPVHAVRGSIVTPADSAKRRWERIKQETQKKLDKDLMWGMLVLGLVVGTILAYWMQLPLK